MQTKKIDPWNEGFKAGKNGETYSANPYEGTPHGTAWAFGCGDGMKQRNQDALQGYLNIMAEA